MALDGSHIIYVMILYSLVSLLFLLDRTSETSTEYGSMQIVFGFRIRHPWNW